jgi:tetratricopeptide (TPR) repeat protein
MLAARIATSPWGEAAGGRDAPGEMMPQASQDLLQQAVRSHQRGDIAAAERLYRKVLAQAPRDFHALHLLGVVRAQQQKFAEAERLLDKALEVDPGSGEALANRGNVLSELGRHDEAVESFVRALRLQPNNAGVRFNLGNALKKARKYEAAADSYAAALRLQPNYLDALFNLADMLRHLSRHDEAIAHLRRILAIQPSNAEATTILGKALQEAGRLEEGVEAFERAIALDPAMVDAYFSLSGMPGTASARHLPVMEALARDHGRLAPPQLGILHFALGRTYEKAERYDDAFRSLIEGNRIKRRLLGYDEAATRRRFERLQQIFTPALQATKAGAGSDSDLPIFVLGFPRSGTTLTEQILASHPAVHGAGELNYIGEIAASLRAPAAESLFFPECLPSLPAADFRRHGDAYVGQLRAIAPDAPRVTDKMPANYMFVGLIHLMLPRAKILHVRRNPIDTCVSCFSLEFGGDLDYANDLGELGRYYRMYHELMAHWRGWLPEGVMLEVRYEEVVDDLETEARRILDFCGLPWDERCLEFHKTERPVTTASVLQVRQPIYRSSIERWRRYEGQLGPLFQALGPVAIDLSSP